MELQQVAAGLYALTPAEFTAARNGQAKVARQAGDKELAARITALPKPTTAAWAVNLLVRGRSDEVARLLALGAQLRAAQESMAGDDLRELNRRQHQLLVAVRREAEQLAAQHGHPLADAIAQRVQGTLHAAMADADAADAVRSGLLVTDLESTGLAPVELEGAVAIPGAAALVPGMGTVGARPARAAGEASGEVAVDSEPSDDVRVGGRRPAKGTTRPAKGAAARDRAARDRAEREQAARDQAVRDRAEREQAERDRAEREQAERRQRAEQAAVAAESKAATLAADREAAESALADVVDRRAALEAEIEDLEARLTELKSAARQAVRLEMAARATRDAAARRAAAAAKEAAALRDRVPSVPAGTSVRRRR